MAFELTIEFEREGIHVNFEDNRLLPLLYGEHDKHLAQIESRLGVSLISRGNHLAITGPSDLANVARLALDALYRKLTKGHSVDAAEVMLRCGWRAVAWIWRATTNLRSKPARNVSCRVRQLRRGILRQSRSKISSFGARRHRKTYLAVCSAVAMLSTGQSIEQSLSRPAVEAGERLGFLGRYADKVDLTATALRRFVRHDAGRAGNASLDSSEIEIAPLAFMRGRTLSNAFVILDEAQNTTPMQMKMR